MQRCNSLARAMRRDGEGIVEFFSGAARVDVGMDFLDGRGVRFMRRMSAF